MIVGAIAAGIAVASAGKRAEFFAEILEMWRRALRRAIADPAKLAAGQAQLDVLEQAAAQLAGHSIARAIELAAVHRCYASTLADYDAVIDGLVEDLYADQARIVDGVHELRGVIGDRVYLEIMTGIEADLRKAKAKRERKGD